MQPIRDLAIVLKTTPFEERHRIVTALTESHGLVTALAKNSIQSRRFGACLEPFAASEWMFTQKPGSELVQLTETHYRNHFDGLVKDFQLLALASTLNEVILRIAPRHHPCLELFQLHSNSLFLINTGELNQKPIALLNAYLAKVLQWSGNQPRLGQCLQCETPLENFSPDAQFVGLIADAGWVCQNCRGTGTRHVRNREGGSLEHSLLRLSASAIQDLQISLRTPIRKTLEKLQAPEADHRNLFQFLQAFFMFHIPGFDKTPLKSLRFLGEDFSGP